MVKHSPKKNLLTIEEKAPSSSRNGIKMILVDMRQAAVRSSSLMVIMIMLTRPRQAGWQIPLTRCFRVSPESSKCPRFLTFLCVPVPRCPRTKVSPYRCDPVPMCPRTDVSLYLCVPVPMFPRTVSPYRCVPVSPYLCVPVPMCPCVSVDVSPYGCVPVSP